MSRRVRCAAMGVLAVLGLGACGPVRDTESRVPVARIDGIVIRNELAYPVHDTMIEVPATGGYAGCGMILRRSACSTSFPAADYRREALVFRWTEYGEPHAITDIVLEPPQDRATAEAYWLEVIIFASGQAGARLISAPAP
ncbi:MAG: hypothetical protein P8Y54_12330 [Xanthomonadales bacterium]